MLKIELKNKETFFLIGPIFRLLIFFFMSLKRENNILLWALCFITHSEWLLCLALLCWNAPEHPFSIMNGIIYSIVSAPWRWTSGNLATTASNSTLKWGNMSPRFRRVTGLCFWHKPTVSLLPTKTFTWKFVCPLSAVSTWSARLYCPALNSYLNFLA